MGESDQRGHRHFAGADCGLCAGLVLPEPSGFSIGKFSLTIAFAIAISAFNALTLSPALSGHVPARRRGWPKRARLPAHRAALAPLCPDSFTPPTPQISWLSDNYAKAIHGALKLRLRIAGCSSSLDWAQRYGPTSTCLPASFPRKTRGFLMVIVQARRRARSLAYTGALADRAQAIIAN